MILQNWQVLDDKAAKDGLTKLKGILRKYALKHPDQRVKLPIYLERLYTPGHVIRASGYINMCMKGNGKAEYDVKILQAGKPGIHLTYTSYTEAYERIQKAKKGIGKYV